MLHYIVATGIGPDKDFGVTAIIIVMRKRGFAIGQTLAAVEECAAGGWLVRHKFPNRQPDRIALTSVASVALALQPAE